MRDRRIGIGVVALLAAGAWFARAGEPPAAPAGGEDALVKRGEYLVNEVAHCSHCHTPRGDQGRPDRARLLQGATLPIRPKEPTPNWADQAPDLTRSGPAGKWSEADWVKFLTTGRNPHGEEPNPPMPVFHLRPEDARAVTLYLKSLPGKKP
jgi:alcohol dehydrogenase (quinone), cytochrome c subunit